jgi:hypothetical protein
MGNGKRTRSAYSCPNRSLILAQTGQKEPYDFAWVERVITQYCWMFCLQEIDGVKSEITHEKDFRDIAVEV